MDYRYVRSNVFTNKLIITNGHKNVVFMLLHKAYLYTIYQMYIEMKSMFIKVMI